VGGRGAVERAPEKLVEAQQPVAGVEEQAAEHLVVAVPQPRDQEVPRGARAGERRPEAQPLEVVAPDQLERRLQFRPARRADPGVAADVLARRRQQAPEGTEAASSERASSSALAPRWPWRSSSAMSSASVSAPGPEREQLFARLLGRRPVPEQHGTSGHRFCGAPAQPGRRESCREGAQSAGGPDPASGGMSSEPRGMAHWCSPGAGAIMRP
jgi:hypothetical protein